MGGGEHTAGMFPGVVQRQEIGALPAGAEGYFPPGVETAEKQGRLKEAGVGAHEL